MQTFEFKTSGVSSVSPRYLSFRMTHVIKARNYFWAFFKFRFNPTNMGQTVDSWKRIETGQTVS